VALLEPEDNPERRVDLLHFLQREVPGPLAEAAWVDGRRLLDQNLRASP
jgi:hypothetical protein